MQRGFAGIFLLIGLLVVIIIGAYFLFKPTLQKNNLLSEKPSQTNNLATKPEATQKSSKFVYFERTLAKPPEDNTTLAGIVYKDELATYDIATGTKKVFYEESVTQDNVDSYRLIDNQYVAIISPKGDRAIGLNGQTLPTPPNDYFSAWVSPSGQVSIDPKVTEKDITFSVIDKQTNKKQEITMQQPSEYFLAPSIIGWSKDGQSIFFHLISTHASDPTRSLYQLNTVVGEVKRFPRDNSILDVQSTFIDSDKDEIYFVGKTGLFVQPINETKATQIQVVNLDESKIVSLVFPTNYDKHAIAISSIKQLVVKDIDSGDEEVVFEANSDGSVYPTSWRGNNLIYTFRKEGSTGNEKLYGYFINGYVYDVKSKKSTEFVNHKTDSMFTVGRFYFIDWLR